MDTDKLRPTAGLEPGADAALVERNGPPCPMVAPLSTARLLVANAERSSLGPWRQWAQRIRASSFLPMGCVLGVALACLAAAAKADAPLPSPVATPALSGTLPLLGQTQWKGFLQNWTTFGEESGNGPHSYSLAGDYVRHFRVGFTSVPYPGVSVVTLSDLSAQAVPNTGVSDGSTYGVTLLDAYAKADLGVLTGHKGLPLTLTVGQFKPQFGLNRMYTPAQLTLIDYSSIYFGPSGVLGSLPSDAAFWDDGMQLSWSQAGLFEADAAWVNGQGANLGAPSPLVLGNPQQEFTANVSVWPIKIWEVGASYLYGEMFANPGTVLFPGKPKSFTDEYTRLALPGHSFALEVEYLNRSGGGDVSPTTAPGDAADARDRNGLTVTLSQYVCDSLQWVGGYDRVIIYGDEAADSTRFIGGLSYYPGGSVRLSVQEMGRGTGPSQTSAYSWTIVQTQVVF